MDYVTTSNFVDAVYLFTRCKHAHANNKVYSLDAIMFAYELELILMLFQFLRDFGHFPVLSLCFLVLTSQFYSGLPLVVVMLVKLLRLSFVVYGGRV